MPFPRYVDYGKRDGDGVASAGIGYYCLMGAGNHLDFGRSPAPVCAYLRDLAGWCDTVVDLNTPGSYEAEHGRYDVVMKYRTSKPNEYFVIENRSQRGLDRACPSNGLAIYHCDLLGSNELQEGTEARHYQCALLQADGRRDLENTPSQGNRGDATDLYGPIAGTVVSSVSVPHSREWDGRESGLVVSDIGLPGDRIAFRVGQTLPAQAASGEQAPNATIPDNDSAGISSTIAISASGIIRRVRVSVDIRHTYVGDLQIELFAPSGRRSVLHARQGGSSDDLQLALDSNRPGELSNLIGQPMQGNWVLRIADREGQDIGTLRQWAIELSS